MAVVECENKTCRLHAAQLLLGPLRPNIVVCVHQHRFGLDELFPRERKGGL